MAIEKNTGGNGNNFTTKNFSYSAFTGLILERGDRDLYNKTLADIGVVDADIKQGFHKDPNGPAMKARKALITVGIEGYTLSGKLGYIDIKTNKADGIPLLQPLLSIGLNDGNESYYLDTVLSHESAQKLAQKVANVEPGTFIKVGLFAGENQAGFATHSATVKTADGVEVPVVATFKDGAGAAITVKQDALKAAGITDAKTLAAAKDNAIATYFTDLVNKVKPKFEAYRAVNKAPATAAAPAAGAKQDSEEVPF